jgi:hypothetical protein
LEKEHSLRQIVVAGSASGFCGREGKLKLAKATIPR